MIDPREIPAFWGLCGGVLFGAVLINFRRD